MSDIEPPLITAEQIADEAKISMSMLFRLRAKWRIQPYKLGGKTGCKAYYTLDFRDRVLSRKSGAQSVANSASVLSAVRIAQREFKTDIDLMYGPVIGQESDGSPRRKYLGYSPQDLPAHTACYVKAAGGWDAKPGEWGGPDDPGSPPVPPIKGSTDQFDTAGIACILPIARRLWKEYVDKINLYR